MVGFGVRFRVWFKIRIFRGGGDRFTVRIRVSFMVKLRVKMCVLEQ